MSAARSAFLPAAARLRPWALAVLAGAEPDAAGWRAAAEAPAEAWRLFLAAERCALPLVRALDESRWASRLSPAGDTVLRAAAAEDATAALSARMQLVVFGRAAADHGWALVVLKGGVAAMRDATAVGLLDVDVLAAPEQAPAVAAWLDTLGYAAVGQDPAVGRAGAFHLSLRKRAHSVQVEVHYGVRGLDAAAVRARAVPLEGARGMLRPAPADHLLHLALHSAVDHPSRRGRLRDLVLAMQAAAACSARDLAEVRERAAASTHGPVVLRVLALVDRLRAGQWRDDPFAAEAAARLVLQTAPPSIPTIRVGRAMETSIFDMLAGPEAYLRTVWRRVRLPLPTAASGLDALRRRIPSLAKAVEGAGRAGLMLRCAPEAWRVASAARRLLRDAASNAPGGRMLATPPSDPAADAA